jgi:glutaredoxin-like YruB-family protein
MVKVYSINNCPWCDKVKKYLKSRQVDFEERNIENSPEALDECRKLTGDEAVPVITIDGKEFVLGFDKAKIDALLGAA